MANDDFLVTQSAPMGADPISVRVCEPPSGRYCLDDGTPVRSVTELLSNEGLGLDVSAVPQDKLQAKSSIGDTVHAEIKRILLGKKDSSFRVHESSERVEAFMDCWREWYRTTDPFQVLACETSYVWWYDPSLESGGGKKEDGKEKEKQLIAIGGTLDLLAQRYKDGRYLLIDWKTREPKLYDGAQLAGYGYLAAANPAIPLTPIDLQRNTDRVLVSLREDGRPAREKSFRDPFDYAVFHSAVVMDVARKKFFPKRYWGKLNVAEEAHVTAEAPF